MSLYLSLQCLNHDLRHVSMICLMKMVCFLFVCKPERKWRRRGGFGSLISCGCVVFYWDEVLMDPWVCLNLLMIFAGISSIEKLQEVSRFACSFILNFLGLNPRVLC